MGTTLIPIGISSQYETVFADALTLADNAEMNKQGLVDVLERLIREHPDPEIRGPDGKGNQNELARRAHMHQPTLQRILSGGSREPRDSTIKPLADFFGVSVPYLRGYEPPPAGSPQAETVAPAPTLGPIANVPVVGTTQGGVPVTSWVEEGYPVGYSDEVLDVPAKDRNAYALRVIGSSMSPRMREGEYIMLYPNQEVQPGDEVVVKTVAGEVMVKQLAYCRNGEAALDSIAKDHDRIVRKLAEIVYMHFVAGIHPASALRKQG